MTSASRTSSQSEDKCRRSYSPCRGSPPEDSGCCSVDRGFAPSSRKVKNKWQHTFSTLLLKIVLLLTIFIQFVHFRFIFNVQKTTRRKMEDNHKQNEEKKIDSLYFFYLNYFKLQ